MAVIDRLVPGGRLRLRAELRRLRTRAADRAVPDLRWHEVRIRSRLRGRAVDTAAVRQAADDHLRSVLAAAGAPTDRSTIAAIPRTVRRYPTPRRAVRQAHRWDGTGRPSAEAVAAARFVIVPTPQPDPRHVVPILASGRPVVAEVEAADCFRASSSALITRALTQLRTLVWPHPDTPRPLVSVVLSSNRTEYIADAISQIQAQADVRVELLLGLHGVDAAVLDGLDLEAGAIETATVTEFDAATIFGDVLQMLTDQATGGHVAKWDDDDRYAPSHLADLWLAAALTTAPLIGKAGEFVALTGSELLVHRPGGRNHAVTNFVAGGALLVSKPALDAVDGWRPLPRHVDQDLLDRCRAGGLPTLRTHGVGYALVRHDGGHTWDAPDTYFQRTSTHGWAIESLAEAGFSTEPPASDPPTPTEPTLAICVPSRNGHAALDLWTMATASSDRPLVVCDDRSEPPLRADGDSITIVRLDDGEGFGTGRARHAAAQATDADVLVFVDADMYVDPSVFEQIERRFADGFRGAVHGVLDFVDLDPATAVEIAHRDGLPALERRLRDTTGKGQIWREPHLTQSSDLARPRTSSYRQAIGAFLAVDRATYERAGGFRDVPFRGVEDTEFGYRLQASGCDQLVLRSGGIAHLGATTRSSVLAPVDAERRDRILSRLIPVWTDGLGARRALIGTESAGADPITPFAAVPDRTRHAAWGDHLTDDDFDLTRPDGAPFCVALQLDPDHADAALEAAHATFRQRPGGEVLVLHDGHTVARLVAVWALNRAAVRLGRDTIDPADPELLHAVRADIGAAWVEV